MEERITQLGGSEIIVLSLAQLLKVLLEDNPFLFHETTLEPSGSVPFASIAS